MSTWWRWVSRSLAVVAAVAIGLLLFLYSQAVGDKNDAEDALTASQGELDAANEFLDSSEARASDLESQLAEVTTQAADAESAAIEAEASLAEAEASLTETRASLTETQASVDEMSGVFLGFLTASFVEGAGIDQEDALCLSESLLDARGPQILTTFLDIGLGDQADTIGLAEIGLDVIRGADECGLPPELFDQPPLLPGVRYGDNSVLDLLHDQCAAGSGQACDQLFSQSEVGSEYEDFGRTCGDRFSVATAPFRCEGNL